MTGPLTDPLRDAAQERARDPALEDDSRTWSYQELNEAVELQARRLVRAGARPGVRVALVGQTSAEAVVAAHAVFRSGASLSPLDPRWTGRELREAVQTLRPGLVLCDDTSERAVSAISAERLGQRPILSLDGGMNVPNIQGLSPASGPLPDLAADQVQAVIWTSGTSGSPRGVEISRGSLLSHAAAARERLQLRATDAWLASLRLAHVGGLALLHRAPVTGCHLVVREGFSAREFNELADRGRITHASLVPTMLQQVLEEREGRPAPPTLRCVLIGGARAPISLVERALELGFPVALTYGLTEAASQVATAPPALVRRKPGTVGSSLAGVEVRISPEREVLVRGGTLAHGYVGTPEPLTDRHGWLHTGDLGRLDDEGHLWITGRKAQRIVSGGTTVDPQEVEEVLARHPDVQEVAVVGVPDEVWGERVAAAVVPRMGTSPNLAILLGYSRERLSPAKRPREVVLVGALPRNPNGKVDRVRVVELFLGKPRLR